MKIKNNQSGVAHLAVIILVVILGIIGFIGFSISKKTSNSNINLNESQKQFSSPGIVSGYLEYDASKFNEVENFTIPNVGINENGVNTVIVSANSVGWGESGLYLYDLTSNKSYRITDGGGNPRIMSDHFLIYGFDEGKGQNRQLGAKLLNMKTGETKIVFSESPEIAPGTICCSVSPDGFKVALALKNKVSVWDIRKENTTDYKISINPIDESFNRTSANDYATEMGYPTPSWLDNESIVLADKPVKYPVSNTDVFILNTKNSSIKQLAKNESGVESLYAINGSIFMNEVLVGRQDSQITMINARSDESPVNVTSEFSGLHTISPDGKKIIVCSSSSEKCTVWSGPSYKIGSIKPIHEDINAVTQIIPKGWLDNNRMIVELSDTSTNNIHSYIAIYDFESNKVNQYTKIK